MVVPPVTSGASSFPRTFLPASRNAAPGGKRYIGVYSRIGGWIGLPVTAGLGLNDKFSHVELGGVVS